MEMRVSKTLAVYTVALGGENLAYLGLVKAIAGTQTHIVNSMSIN